MSRPTRRLRTRLLVAMVAIAFGVLVIAALGAAALARETASDSAVKDLQKRAPELATLVETLGEQVRSQPVTAAAARRLQTTLVDLLAASGTSTFTINEDGTVTRGAAGLLGRPTATEPTTLLDLPEDLKLRDLDLVALIAGEQQSGVDGSRAYVAVPLDAVNGQTPVVVVTQQVERRPLGRAGTFLLVTGGLALAAAALVSAYLARRMTRPLAAMEEASNQIANGDLSARVDTTGLRDDELAGLTRSFNAMADELETARGHERAFLLSVSHDLRTPLTSIRGYAEAIGDGTVDGSEDRIRAAHVIETEARRLERLVADLLDLARLDTHEFSLTPRPIDARDVVVTTVAGFQPAAREYGIALRTGSGADATGLPGGADPIPADADPERLAQIVANLVENALKYARAEVTVDVRRVAAGIEVHVGDDGPGIPADERERVFDRLHTARPVAGRSVGTGIGLAIVNELAHAMGGSARCEALDGAGVRFVVTVAG
ncbi:MAG: HAMP domain-containing sensor histidine kinase [Acidimicrobiia bacterium]